MIYNINTIEDFNSLSKNLHKAIKKKNSESNIKISTIQESLAQSMGYRNLHGLQSFYNKNSILKNNNYIENFFENGSVKEIFDLIDCFSGEQENDMFKSRSNELIWIILLSLIELRDQKILKINFDTLKEYSKLENITLLINPSFLQSKSHNISDKTKQRIKSFLLSLPNYKSNMLSQSQITKEQYSYLVMYIKEAIDKLEYIKEDVIIFPFIGNIDNISMYVEKLNELDLEKKLPWITKENSSLNSKRLSFEVYESLFLCYGIKNFTLFDFVDYTINHTWEYKSNYKNIIYMLSTDIDFVRKKIKSVDIGLG